MLLKLGSNNNDVKILQEKLNLTPDGNFGPITEKKVKEWQTQNGLTPDGIVGDATWNKLFSTNNDDDLNIDSLKGFIPGDVLDQIIPTTKKFNINSKLRLAHFLSQCAHESGGFRTTRENLNYSEQGLKTTFGKYFPGDLAKSYARQPQKIANRVYANRMGNSNEQSGDGWKYAGKGYIQLTGKYNYSQFSKFVTDDVINNPDLVATKYPLMSAAWFFQNGNIWTICDRGSDDKTIEAVTRAVNGGLNGIDDRKKYFNKFFKLLNGQKLNP